MNEKVIIFLTTVRNTSINNLGKPCENKKAWKNMITIYDSIPHNVKKNEKEKSFA